MREHELEEHREQVFNAMKLMVPHKKEWRCKYMEETTANAPVVRLAPAPVIPTLVSS